MNDDTNNSSICLLSRLSRCQAKACQEDKRHHKLKFLLLNNQDRSQLAKPLFGQYFFFSFIYYSCTEYLIQTLVQQYTISEQQWLEYFAWRNIRPPIGRV